MTDHADAAPALDELAAICRVRGSRLTLHRRAVLAKLLQATRSMTAYELLDVLRPEDPAATPASTCRCLDLLLQHGVAHRLETTRSFIACEHRDHAHAVQFLICRQCGTAVEAEDQRVEAATARLGERLGFAPDQRTVELTGTCATCQDGAAR